MNPRDRSRDRSPIERGNGAQSRTRTHDRSRGTVGNSGEQSPKTCSGMTRYEWRVVYRRHGWRPSTSDQVRVYETEHSAWTYAERLFAGGRPDLRPLKYVRVERRPVGPWEAMTS